jgi:GMP synthase-like glutamine amidotransferase
VSPADRVLWVIDPSLRNAEDQGVGVVLDGWSGSSRVLRPVLSPGDGPRPGDGYDTDGIVVLGSAASVHDPSPWIRELGRWLDPLLADGPVRPVLGVCFGHQLVAWRAGGEVGFLSPDRFKRVGVETSRLAGGRLLRGRRSLRVVVSHREVVRRAPPGYRVVARRTGVDVDGLEHETRPVFSYQFHPEAREEFADRAGIDRALLDDRLHDDSEALLAAFRNVVLADERRRA